MKTSIERICNIFSVVVAQQQIKSQRKYFIMPNYTATQFPPTHIKPDPHTPEWNILPETHDSWMHTPNVPPVTYPVPSSPIDYAVDIPQSFHSDPELYLQSCSEVVVNSPQIDHDIGDEDDEDMAPPLSNGNPSQQMASSVQEKVNIDETSAVTTSSDGNDEVDDVASEGSNEDSA